ncbi:MAG TPA: PEP-CTERM sorting domain-containing protein, partial [Sedimentisphaerales bacterium]|nr:PEP-CTERM sorting domain-containing protein [Sedimentisphaerales bacterium]
KWEAFNESNSNFMFTSNGIGKTWNDWLTFTTTVDFTTGEYKVYIDGQLYISESGKTGSFADLARFNIGRTDYSGTAASMADFRIYNRALTAEDVAALPIVAVPEPVTLALLGLGSLALLKRKK